MRKYSLLTLLVLLTTLLVAANIPHVPQLTKLKKNQVHVFEPSTGSPYTGQTSVNSERIININGVYFECLDDPNAFAYNCPGEGFYEFYTTGHDNLYTYKKWAWDFSNPPPTLKVVETGWVRSFDAPPPAE